MTTPTRGAGRPRSSSRETIAEAACELFLERGFDGTHVAEIAARAGVSRSSFFNYFSSKSDVLWAGLDARVSDAEAALRAGASADVSTALLDAVDGFAPDALALAITNADAMGLTAELDRERSTRQGRLQQSIARHLGASGAQDASAALSAQVRAGAYSSALFAAVWIWADRRLGALPLPVLLADALRAVEQVTPASPPRKGHPLA